MKIWGSKKRFARGFFYLEKEFLRKEKNTYLLALLIILMTLKCWWNVDFAHTRADKIVQWTGRNSQDAFYLVEWCIAIRLLPKGVYIHTARIIPTFLSRWSKRTTCCAGESATVLYPSRHNLAMMWCHTATEPVWLNCVTAGRTWSFIWLYQIIWI